MQCLSYVLFTVVTCPELTNPDNGGVTTTGATFGSLASYTCNTGYILTPSDDATRMCRADGEWTGVAATCPRELANECCV